MADLPTKKISELPIADSLGDTDVLVGVQAGVTKRFPGSVLGDQGQPLRASKYGVKGDGVTYDTAKLAEFFDALVTSGKLGEIDPGFQCLIESLVIPAGVRLLGRVNFRTDGSLTSEVALTIEGSSAIQHLSLSTPGTDAAFDFIHIGPNVTMESLELTSDIQRAGTGGAVLRGNDFYLGRLTTRNIARPFQAQSETPGQFLNNVNIFSYDITRYIRGINFTAVDGYYVGRGIMRGQDSRASKTPGHNGILLIACKNGRTEAGDIGDSGEHGIRIGGSATYPGNCENIDFGVMTIRRPGGCGFKSNPNLGELLKNCRMDGLIVEDGGRDTTDGNAEPLRVSEYDSLSIGFVEVRTTQYATTCTAAIALSTGKRLTIGPVNAPNCKDRIIRLIDTQDESLGNFEDCEIGPINGSVTNDRVPIELTYLDTVNVRSIGNVRFKVGDIGNFTVALMEVTGSPVTTGPIRITGNVSGTTTPNIICPASDDWQADIAWKSFRYMGRAADAMYGWPMAIGAPQFNPAVAGTGALALKSRGATGLGSYGAGIVMCRPNSTREAVAIAPQQTGNTAGRQQFGLVAFVQNTGATSDETKTRAFEVDHFGNFLPGSDAGMSIGSASTRWDFVHARTVRTHPVAVASLPTPAAAGSGARAFVTDATATTFASVVTGGGSNSVPVYSDGAAWRIG